MELNPKKKKKKNHKLLKQKWQQNWKKKDNSIY